MGLIVYRLFFSLLISKVLFLRKELGVISLGIHISLRALELDLGFGVGPAEVVITHESESGLGTLAFLSTLAQYKASKGQ